MKKIILVLSALFFIVETPIAFATVFYVDSLGGSDSNNGLTEARPWKTLHIVNQQLFRPGDKILLKRGSVWEEKLIISSSGSPEQPILFAGYGEGANPVIKPSNTFGSWRLVVNQGNKKVWYGVIRGIRNHWSALREGKHLPKYYPYEVKDSVYSAPAHPSDMINGMFYSPLNREGFYFRNDNGQPGDMEIGVRSHGIFIKGQKNLVIDGIDVYGPGGRAVNGGATGSAQIVVDSSENVVVKNLEISYGHNNGIRIVNASKNCKIEYVKAHDHRATGVYFWEAGSGNSISNSEVYNSSIVKTDTGDMGLIGVWRSPYSRVEACYVHDNGHPGIEGMDAAISIVESPHATIIRNLVMNVGGTGIQIASDVHDSVVAYNIIDGWGRWGASFRSGRHSEGIRLGRYNMKNVKIYNNLITGGGGRAVHYAALRILKSNSEGLEVRNNIFLENGANFEIIAESTVKKPVWSFSNNIFYRAKYKADDPGIKILGKAYLYNHIVGDRKGYFTEDWKPARGGNTLIIDPGLNLKSRLLRSNSAVIDQGVSVGLSQDFHGNPVPVGSAVDIGPFEFQGGLAR